MTKKDTPRLNRLLDEVEELCANKTELAEYLGVTKHHVYNWLTSRKSEPGGEITLAMQEWVAAERAKTKQKRSPGRARTRPRPKTQPRKISDEKPKSGPKKK